MTRRRARSFPAASPALEALEARLMLDGAGLIINEFLASNAENHFDEDGDSSDWIELYNDSDVAVDLGGWYLTDDPDNPGKWAFPSRTLGPYQYLLVYASDKDRADPDGQLHTNFKLDADGEYLALVQFDEDDQLYTAVQEFAPTFPPQVPDVSYGLGRVAVPTAVVDPALEAETDVIAWVPDTELFDETWMDVGLPVNFPDWMEGTLGVGYDEATRFRPYIGLDVEWQMLEKSESIYIRVPFTVEDVGAVRALALRMRYDDGFVAYLNGVEVASANAPDEPDWESGATASHPDSQAVQFETFDISDHVGALETGDNLLAIHGLNYGDTSPDMLIAPELVAWVEPPDQPELGWRYFQTPTPGAMNGEGFLGYVDSPDASIAHGLFDEPISVALTSATPEAIIRYTTDCSEPTETHGTLYTPGTPIAIETSTILRTIAYLPDGSGWRPSATTTYTYILLDDVLAQSDDQAVRGFPAQWIAGFDHYTHGDRQVRDADYAIDPDVALDVGDLLTIPSVSLVMNQDDLWDPFTGIYPNSIQRASSNPQWEKPASLELIHPYGTDDGFTINAGARINGELSRWAAANDKQSFRIVFQGDYGPTKLRTDELFGGGAADAYDTLILRAMWGESFLRDETLGTEEHPFLAGDPTGAQYLRDLYAHETYAATGNLDPRGQFVHLYLNGLYWGLYQVTERPDNSFNAAYQGGSPDDYDIIKGHVSYTGVNGELQDGERAAWNTLFSYFDTDGSGNNLYGEPTVITDTALGEIAEYLDLEAFADYMITLWVIGRYDFPSKNWYAAGRRSETGGPPEIPFRFYTWDSEASLGQSGAAGPLDRWHGTDADNDTGPVRIYRRLITNAAFRRLWMDRVQALMFDGGPLSTEANLERYENLAHDIDKAIVGESARWGDWPTEYTQEPLTYGEDWIVERDRVGEAFLAQRNQIVLDQMLSVDMWTEVAAPQFDPDGGGFDAGAELTMTDPAAAGGTIWYTTDGTDPRGEASTPTRYTGPLALTGPVAVTAAIEHAGQWSALREALFQPRQLGPLVITELNYNPPSLPGDDAYNNDDFEFVELYNDGSATIDLESYAFVEGISFDFPAGATLAPGQYALIVRNAEAFAHRYGDTTGLTILGEYDGALSNGGERITLNTAGELYCSFTYDDGGGWPGRADGKGATLETLGPGDLSDDDTWRSSGEFLGSPGTAGAGVLGDVVVTEVASRTVPAPAEVDQIELHNTTGSAINISGWYLSDTWTDYRKFRIPDGTSIPAGGYVSFSEDEFGFNLDSALGDDVWVMAADTEGALTRFVDHVDFGAGLDGLSHGRWPDAAGRLVPMTEKTFGAANSGPLFGPVIVHEVMYDTTDTDLEFIELYNAGAADADLGGWRLDSAVEFTFDAGTVLPAGAYLLVLPFDPTASGNAARLAAFNAAYDVTGEVTMVGGWTGHLNNTGERIDLLYRRPDSGPRVWSFVPGDEATFDDDDPWPPEAAGGGSALGRIGADAWGNDPASWEAVAPSPGLAQAAPPMPGDADLDGDVDLDDFMVLKQNFGTPSGATWAQADFTGDGAVDLDDFMLLKQNFGSVAPTGATVNVLAELRVDDGDEAMPPARRADRAVRRLRRRGARRERPGDGGPAAVLDLIGLERPLG